MENISASVDNNPIIIYEGVVEDQRYDDNTGNKGKKVAKCRKIEDSEDTLGVIRAREYIDPKTKKRYQDYKLDRREVIKGLESKQDVLENIEAIRSGRSRNTRYDVHSNLVRIPRAVPDVREKIVRPTTLPLCIARRLRNRHIKVLKRFYFVLRSLLVFLETANALIATIFILNIYLNAFCSKCIDRSDIRQIRYYKMFHKKFFADDVWTFSLAIYMFITSITGIIGDQSKHIWLITMFVLLMVLPPIIAFYIQFYFLGAYFLILCAMALVFWCLYPGVFRKMRKRNVQPNPT